MKNKTPRKFDDLLEEHQVNQKNNSEVVEEIDIDLIMPNPNQPRKKFDEDKIDNLALSIRQNGLFQPIIVKKTKDKYMIIAGERRFRAFQHLNSKKIPAIIRQYQNNKVPEIALIENIQREDLNPIEEARAYQYILENGTYKNHELALKVGKSRSHVINMIGLLRLPEDVQKKIEAGLISMGHARAISKLRSEKEMKKLTDLVLNKNFSVRQLEAHISEINKKTIKNNVSVRIQEVEHKINSTFEVKSVVRKGSISIKGNEINIDKVLEKLLK